MEKDPAALPANASLKNRRGGKTFSSRPRGVSVTQPASRPSYAISASTVSPMM